MASQFLMAIPTFFCLIKRNPSADFWWATIKA